jgi:hypothetical protein
MGQRCRISKCQKVEGTVSGLSLKLRIYVFAMGAEFSKSHAKTSDGSAENWLYDEHVVISQISECPEMSTKY